MNRIRRYTIVKNKNTFVVIDENIKRAINTFESKREADEFVSYKNWIEKVLKNVKVKTK